MIFFNGIFRKCHVVHSKVQYKYKRLEEEKPVTITRVKNVMEEGTRNREEGMGVVEQ